MYGCMYCKLDPLNFWQEKYFWTIFCCLFYLINISELFFCRLFHLIFLSSAGSPLTAGLTGNGKDVINKIINFESFLSHLLPRSKFLTSATNVKTKTWSLTFVLIPWIPWKNTYLFQPGIPLLVLWSITQSTLMST